MSGYDEEQAQYDDKLRAMLQHEVDKPFSAQLREHFKYLVAGGSSAKTIAPSELTWTRAMQEGRKQVGESIRNASTPQLAITATAITAAALSVTYLVHKLRQRKAAQQVETQPQHQMSAPPMPAAQAQHTAPRTATAPTAAATAPKENSAQSIISQLGEAAGMDKRLTDVAGKLTGGEGLSLADIAKAGSALAASRAGGGGENADGIATAAKLAETVLGGNGQGWQKDPTAILSDVLQLFGGQNAERGR